MARAARRAGRQATTAGRAGARRSGALHRLGAALPAAGAPAGPYLEQLVLEGGGEAVKAQVAQHEQQAKDGGVGRCVLALDRAGHEEEGAAQRDERGIQVVLAVCTRAKQGGQAVRDRGSSRGPLAAADAATVCRGGRSQAVRRRAQASTTPAAGSFASL